MSENAENPAINDENKIPVNIITGFLGSGKTTLLNHWVNSEDFKDTLVLINEFGDVGLDHELVESVDSSVVLLQSGCICCSLQGALVDSLATNYIKAQRGEIPQFKRVIIETTGLADPSGVIGTLNGDDFLLDHYYHDGTVTVIDGMFVRDQLKKQYEAVKQIALADIVIVSKTDLIESDELDAIYEITAKINPAAKVFPAVKGNISPKILFDIGPYKNADQAFDKKVTSWLNFKSPNLASSIRPATVNSTIGVSKPKIIAHSDIDSFCMEFDEPIEVIHGVQGNLYPLSELHSWPNGERRSQLVFICRASVMEQIEHMFKQIMENPDSAAISYYQQMIDGIERADDY